MSRTSCVARLQVKWTIGDNYGMVVSHDDVFVPFCVT
jgi:hypothetical protein